MESSSDEPNVILVKPTDIFDELGFGAFQIFMTIYTGIIFCAEACELTLLSLLLPDIGEHFNLSKYEESLAGSIVFVGLLFGNLFWGVFADFVGRRFSLGSSNALLAIFGSLRAISPNFWFFNICGFFCGFSIGGNVNAFTLYVECLPIHRRGIALISIDLFWVLGSCYNSGIGWMFLKGIVFEKYRWNWFVLFSVFPVLISLILLPFSPESMRYMYIKKNEYGMKSLIERIEWMNCRKMPENYKIDFRGVEQNVKVKNNESSFNDDSIRKKIRTHYLDLFKGKTLLMLLSLCTFFATASICYYGVVLAAGNSFFKDRFLGSFLSSLAELPGIVLTICCFFLFSRKFTQFLGFLISGITLLMMCFPNMGEGWNICFGVCARASVMSAGSCIWILAQESLPTSVRSVGCGIASSCGKFASIFAPFISEVFPENQELVPKLVFAFVSIFSAILCIFYPWETKGKPLKEIVE